MVAALPLQIKRVAAKITKQTQKLFERFSILFTTMIIITSFFFLNFRSLFSLLGVYTESTNV